MADVKLPYVPSSGVITRTLDKIKEASAPDRFTQDFLATKLAVKGGSAKPVIPFLKRTGFLNPDGSPTALYTRFRNLTESGAAAAEALRTGYKPLYESNEYAHDLSDKDLKGLVVQVSGLEPDSGTTSAIVGSFKALKGAANFDAASAEVMPEAGAAVPLGAGAGSELAKGLTLGYTINLHLPATSDVAVFNAIFRSLREHLLH